MWLCLKMGPENMVLVRLLHIGAKDLTVQRQSTQKQGKSVPLGPSTAGPGAPIVLGNTSPNVGSNKKPHYLVCTLQLAGNSLEFGRSRNFEQRKVSSIIVVIVLTKT